MHIKPGASLLAFSFLIAGTLLSGCNTPRYNGFTKVQPGMEKDQVLEAAGGPNVSRRWHGKDRWIYDYKQTPEGNQTREVHFENGKAVYVGDKYVPKVSAAEQDRINDESNAALEKKTAEENRDWERARGVARTQYKSAYTPKPGTFNPSRKTDDYDRRFYESTYGVQTVDKDEPTKLAPTFESVD